MQDGESMKAQIFVPEFFKRKENNTNQELEAVESIISK